MEKNLKQALDFKAKIAVGKMGKSRFGMVEIMNIDGHDLIRGRLIELSKSSDGCQIEILMNLPGGALFFLPTFKGIFQNYTHVHLNLKWGASSRWSSSPYCPGRNPNQMTITKAHPTLQFQRRRQQWKKIQ